MMLSVRPHSRSLTYKIIRPLYRRAQEVILTRGFVANLIAGCHSWDNRAAGQQHGEIAPS